MPDGQRSRQQVAKRSAKGALMLSCTPSLSEGGTLLTDQELATALLDRLLPPPDQQSGAELPAQGNASSRSMPLLRDACTGDIVCKGRVGVP